VDGRGQGDTAHPSAPGDLIVTRATDGVGWDKYVSKHPHGTVDHLWGWQQVFTRALGQQPLYLEARRGQTLVGVLPVVLMRSWLFGRSVTSLPFLNYGGVLADDAAAADALVSAVGREAGTFGASHVELRHVVRQFPSLPVRQHKLAMRRPLPSTADELWGQVDRKVRNQVRKAQKTGLVAVDGGTELVDEFYAVFARNMRDLGTPVYPRALFVETMRAFPDRARVFVVRHEGRAVAAGISLLAGGVVLNPWASSLREARPLSPNMLLYWRMLEWAVALGATVFDFGRSSPGGGTYQFKVQWGASAEPLSWEYVLLSRAEPPDQSPSNPKFEMAIAAWQRLPLPVANLIGPLIARQLP
jgi:serine/alanine adding enzyme